MLENAFLDQYGMIHIVQCWGYLISSAPVVHVSPLKTPCGLVIPLLQNSQSHVATITCNYFSRCSSVYTIITLTNSYTLVTEVT
jgi:hypothetical protein